MTSIPAAPQFDLDSAFGLDQPLKGNASAEQAGAPSWNDDYRVRIPNFEGPLDLLLHLIRKDQLNIYDIPIASICASYLKYIDLLHQLDCNMAGEFMVMAATLMHMKSAVLLPQETGENGEEVDPRLPLVAQLLEYEKFKRASETIDKLPWLGRDYYSRPPEAIKDQIPTESLLDSPLEPIDNFQLLVCLKIALDRTTRPKMQITTDLVSLRSKVMALQDLMQLNDILELSSLIPENFRGVRISSLTSSPGLQLVEIKISRNHPARKFQPHPIRCVRSLGDLNEGMLDTY